MPHEDSKSEIITNMATSGAGRLSSVLSSATDEVGSVTSAAGAAPTLGSQSGLVAAGFVVLAALAL